MSATTFSDLEVRETNGEEPLHSSSVVLGRTPQRWPLRFFSAERQGRPYRQRSLQLVCAFLFTNQAKALTHLASGFARQYEGLEALYQKYKDDGFVVLGFPCNQFGGQEPGTDEEVAVFCT